MPTNSNGQPCPYAGVEFDFIITNAGTFDLYIESTSVEQPFMHSLEVAQCLPIHKRQQVIPSVPDPNHCIIGGPGMAAYEAYMANQ